MKDKIKKALKAIGIVLKNVFSFEEVFYSAGLGLLTFGVYQLHPAAAWITCGTVLISTSFFIAYQKVKSNGVSDGN